MEERREMSMMNNIEFVDIENFGEMNIREGSVENNESPSKAKKQRVDDSIQSNEAMACGTAKTKASIITEFRELIRDPKQLDEAANYLYSSLLDDAIFGVIIEVHRLQKTGNLDALEGVQDEPDAHPFVDKPNFDVFGVSTNKKVTSFSCPNCGRRVGAARFAPHLENCMGMGRLAQRRCRRLANKTGAVGSAAADSSSTSATAYTQGGSDDENDTDWSTVQPRGRRSAANTRNTSKRGSQRK